MLTTDQNAGRMARRWKEPDSRARVQAPVKWLPRGLNADGDEGSERGQSSRREKSLQEAPAQGADDVRYVLAWSGRRQPARVRSAHFEDSGARQPSKPWERLVRINPGTCVVHFSLVGNDREYVTSVSRSTAHPVRRLHVNRTLGILLVRGRGQRVIAEIGGRNPHPRQGLEPARGSWDRLLAWPHL